MATTIKDLLNLSERGLLSYIFYLIVFLITIIEIAESAAPPMKSKFLTKLFSKPVFGALIFSFGFFSSYTGFEGFSGAGMLFFL